MMQKFIRYNLLWAILTLVGLTSCEHEIDFDYPTSDAMVVIEGQVNNERTFVRISHTRPIGDNSKDKFVSDAQVWIASDDGHEEQLVYDPEEHCYLSATGLVGIPGHTYQMRAIVDDHHFEASSTMQLQAAVDTVYFRWIKVMSERIYFYCFKGFDSREDDRAYFLCRLWRGDEVFRWSPRSGRSRVNGNFEYDIVCSTEKEMEDGIDEDGKIPLMEGDTIRMELMAIDRPSWEYFQSLMVSENTTANPITNIKGGAQGVFVAANITRPDTIVFNKEKAVREQ